MSTKASAGRIQWVAGLLALLATSCTTPERDRSEARVSATAPVPFRAGTVRQVTGQGDNVKPFIVARPGGGAYLAWAGRDAEKTSVFVSVSRDGLIFNPPVRISTDGMALDLGAESGPQMAVTGDRTIHVIWVAGNAKPKLPDSNGPKATGKMPERPANLNIHLASSHDDGKTFSPPQKINDDEGGAEHRFPTVAVDHRGTVYALWLDKRGQSGERPDFSRVYIARSTDGGRTFSANVDATQGQDHGICHCCKLALAVHSRHGIFAGFRNAVGDIRDAHLVRSRDGGAHFDRPVTLEDTRWVIPGCPMNGPSLAFDKADRLHALWLTGGNVPGSPVISSDSEGGSKVLYRILDLRLGSWSEPLFLALGSHPRLAVAPSGTAYVAWEKEGLQLARIPAHRGAPITSMQLSEPGVMANFASLAIASNGQLLAAWQQADAAGHQQIFLTSVTTR